MAAIDSGEVSLFPAEMRSGRRVALDRLLPMGYAEMKGLASNYMRHQRAGQTVAKACRRAQLAEERP